MSWIGRFTNLFRQKRLDAEIAEELASHIEEAIERGRSAEEARRAFGRQLLQRERSRSAGLLAGLLLSFFLTRLLSSQLFAVTATDPLTFVGVSIAMLAVATCAALLPAHRAISIDPIEALRQE